MKQEALSQFPMMWLVSLAMLIFLTFFVGMLIWVSRRQNKPLFANAANLPLVDGVLEEGENNE
jgi:cbb3-type cytochrome oxidase subunit 3